jgi:Cu/Ag efflux pump CusA
MLNAIIRFSLHQRLLIIALSLFLMGFGAWQAVNMPIDVFPNLNRPRVVVMTEAPGMAPEEVEALITFPLETTLNGANGVQAVRTSSAVGVSVIYVEFDWGTDIYDDRQIVMERLQLVRERLPKGIQPTLAPISSIMGQIVMLGMWSETGETGPLQLRTLADWVVRQRLLSIPGVSQVFTMGGGRKQFQVLVDPDALLRYGITLHDVKRACQESNENATGGYLDERGPNELLVRALGRIQTLEDLKQVVITVRDHRPVSLAEVATVVEGPQTKRGDSSAFIREQDGGFSGGPAVVLTINKQPEADTRGVTEEVMEALEEIGPTLPADVRIEPELYSQKKFIDRAIENVIEALRDGTVLVVMILFLFLLNFRTTFITLTAIPLSIAITALVFAAFGMSINTMTLGGIAIAIGELVDDAIVDVENIFRRLQENRRSNHPKNALLVVFQASAEIRNSIVFGTIIVVLVFVPIFALSGMPGRLFTPLGIAYIVSILSSLLVSLTLTPVLSYMLLHGRWAWPFIVAVGAPVLCVGGALLIFPEAALWLQIVGGVAATGLLYAVVLLVERFVRGEGDGFVLRLLKWLAGGVIAFSIRNANKVLLVAVAAVLVAGLAVWRLERDYLPPFNEGSVQLNVILPPGTSLRKSNEIAATVEERLRANPDVLGFVRRTGRAELDEHAEGVNASEIIIDLDPRSPRSREEQLDKIRDAMKDVPGIVTSVEQPLAHLISHMLSGVKAQVGIKLYGDDLNVLREKAQELKAAMQDVEGVEDLMVEPQVVIPQLRIKLDREKLKTYGLTPVYVNEYVATAMNGEVVSQVLIGQRTFDLLVRMDENYREDLDALRRLSIDLPQGGTTPLSSVAKIYESGGPNTINREQVRRRIVIQCNVSGRGLVDVVKDIQKRHQPIKDKLPLGYNIDYSGQFEAEQDASSVIGLLFIISMLGVFLVLFTMFRSVNFALQVMVALPMAFIGSVAALVLTEQTLTVASIVGFISLAGIASRNGILLLNHYLHLVRYEGETWSKEMIVRAGKERMAPVLMTALTSGIGLVPLALAAGEPGKEILYPVATVIIGGLISSTLLEFVVRPALFWTVGRHVGERIISTKRKEVALVEESEEQASQEEDEVMEPQLTA